MTPRSLATLSASAALCLGLAACGGKTGTLQLSVVTSPTDDPFAQAATARLTVGDNLFVQSAPVTGGRFSLEIAKKPPGTEAPLLLEALDAQGAVLAYGRTPPVQLVAADQGPIAIWVGRPGRVAAAAATFAPPRTEMASAAVTGMGIVYGGGRGPDGAPLAATAVYNVFTQSLIETSPLPQARAGASAAYAGGLRAGVFGGATAGGFGSPAAPRNDTILFDPTVGTGL